MASAQRCLASLLVVAFAGGVAGTALADSPAVSRTVEAGRTSEIQNRRAYEARIQSDIEATRNRQYVDQQLWLLRQERLRAVNRPAPVPLDVPVFQGTPRR